MSLHYCLYGLPCTFCGCPVFRLHIYINALVTQHEPGYAPDCVYRRTEPPVDGVSGAVPHAPAPSTGSTVRAA